ncbi:MAG: glycosyltransferase [Burkholderiales bacterium]|jgi:glycosyltransferase involved in cell wall biosynthesis|nr:glycosyltransferase [Burkholderiales bacterium]
MAAVPRVAIVHDWLDTWGGGENVLAELLRAHPSADLYALVDFLPDALRARIGGRRARTTFLQRVPGARRHFRMLLPLFPRAIESLDVSAYDLVVSDSHAVAKGVRTAPSQLHLCYCHTPMRYAWDLRDQYLAPRGLAAGWKGALAHRTLDRLRVWDRRTSGRVTEFVANSEYVRDRIARCYGRAAAVIHPPVDTAFFTPPAHGAPPPRDYYFAASRWVPYKRMDLVARAFRDLPDRRLVLAGDGPERARVRAAAGPNVEFAGAVSQEAMRDLLRGARAFVFAAEEDFGILPVEAQACGTPVIAFGRGGARETVRDRAAGRPTGLFFDAQTPEALAAAVRRFEAEFPPIDARDCRANAQRFSAERFHGEWSAFVARAQRAFAQREG